jgi:predicted nicotinamide N-methyase
MITDASAFIRANTRILAAPHVPEIPLHLADDAVALWEMTEDQLGEMGLPPPFWAFAWAGGQALARFVLDHPDRVEGKSVADIASGCAIAAIAAMKAGAVRATAIDIDRFAAHAAHLNAGLNGVTLSTSETDPIGAPVDADIIMVGDLFYDRDLAKPLLDWLHSLQQQGKTVIVGDPGRTYFPKTEFAPLATYRVPVTRALEDAEIKTTGVWRLIL